MEFQEHSPRKFEIMMWSLGITIYIVHCSFCNGIPGTLSKKI
jgi:hypothetical protein